MTKQQFYFVETLPVDRSKREQELVQAKARSHAATVAHRWTDTKQKVASHNLELANIDQFGRTTTKRLCSSVGLRSKFPIIHDTEDLVGNDTDIYLNDPCYGARVHEQLDPFLKLAGHTTIRERNLLHFYLIVSSATVYGIRSGALHCPVRDTTVYNIQTNNVWLQWTLLYAEMSAIGLSAAEIELTTLTRRSQIYRYMSGLISDPATRFSDYTITGLNFAGLVGSRLGSLSSARKHLAAGKKLIRKRGGIQELPFTISLPTCCIWIWVGLGSHAFSDAVTFELAISRFTTIMMGVQNWVSSLLHLINEWGGSVYLIPSSPLAKYLLARIHLFSPLSPLYYFVGEKCCENAHYQIRSHVALLWVINNILYELRDDHKQCIDFLEALQRYVESASELSPRDSSNTDGTSKPLELKTMTIIVMLGRVVELFLPNEPDKEVYGISCLEKKNSPILRWWKAFEILELLYLLSSVSRERVLRQLSGWLIGSITDYPVVLTEDELGTLAQDMREAYYSECF